MHGVDHIRCYSIVSIEINSDYITTTYPIKSRIVGKPAFTKEFVEALPRVDYFRSLNALCDFNTKFYYENNGVEFVALNKLI